MIARRLLAATALALPALAQAGNGTPRRILVGFPTGGGTACA